jgi:hypothetical protein
MWAENKGNKNEQYSNVMKKKCFHTPTLNIIMFSDAAYYADITIFHTLLLNFLSITYKKGKFRVLLNIDIYIYTHTKPVGKTGSQSVRKCCNYIDKMVYMTVLFMQQLFSVLILKFYLL